MMHDAPSPAWRAPVAIHAAAPAAPWRPTPAAAAVNPSRDPDPRLVCVVGEGTWDVQDANRHFAALAERLSDLRGAGATVRVLVDLRTAADQPPATRACIDRWAARVYRPDDRVAIIVGSSIQKAALRATPVVATRELFLSEKAARDWLLAYA
jgi:hypothetical protein